MALHGLVGSGKSQIAAESLYQHFDNYLVAIWLNGNDHVTLETQFSQIARRLGFSTTGGNCQTEVPDWLTTLSKRLSDKKRNICNKQKS